MMNTWPTSRPCCSPQTHELKKLTAAQEAEGKALRFTDTRLDEQVEGGCHWQLGGWLRRLRRLDEPEHLAAGTWRFVGLRAAGGGRGRAAQCAYGAGRAVVHGVNRTAAQVAQSHCQPANV